jgi:hypothetical protein
MLYVLSDFVQEGNITSCLEDVNLTTIMLHVAVFYITSQCFPTAIIDTRLRYAVSTSMALLE